MKTHSAEYNFQKKVALRYQLYNGLFLTLPFTSLETTGIKLPVFAEMCAGSLAEGGDPVQIVDSFFRNIQNEESFEGRIATLFLFVQLIERQVVLFDALEEVAFPYTRGLNRGGTIDHCFGTYKGVRPAIGPHTALERYRIRVVLTAHPTQFYPESILGISEELAKILSNDDLQGLELLLLQLGKTSFKNSEAPTPLSEAKNLLRRIHDPFYEAILAIEEQVTEAFGEERADAPVVELGFWPGGDRDGNPFVDVATTLEVASQLRQCAIDHYLTEIAKLRRRLTFPGMADALDGIEQTLTRTSDPKDLMEAVGQLCDKLVAEHQSLFLEEAQRLYSAVRSFGFHFASLDLRQDSSVHEAVIGEIINSLEEGDYHLLEAKQKLQLLVALSTQELTGPPITDHPLASDFLGSLKAVEQIQQSNGPRGMHRYIISNSKGAHHVMEVYFAARLVGYRQVPLDIVPLFETIEDLKNSVQAMTDLYELPLYRQHLEQRGNRQVVMVGYSDGTKDGGYISCNWEIFLAKQKLEAVSAERGIEIIFFDGRGGPPARGGGNTHKFYRALSSYLSQVEVQLTLQGQTISSNFGSYQTARYNLEQLFTSGIENKLNSAQGELLNDEDLELLSAISDHSYRSYMALRNHPSFLSFLEKLTPLSYFGDLNIASRPVTRGGEQKLTLGNLRAIPFVGSWSQIKLNVPGYYGLGSALEWACGQGKEKDLQRLYRESLFFRTLFDNAMQALAKSDFSYTRYLLNDSTFGPFVGLLHDELHRTKAQVLKIVGQKHLLDCDPLNQQSIAFRETMIRPLVIIQQFTIAELQKCTDAKQRNTLEKLLLKTIAPITNASRNSS